MQPTKVQTYADIPAAGSGQQSFPVAEAGNTFSVRVVLENIGPVMVFLAAGSQELADAAPTNATFRLLAGRSTVFVLEKGQKLYAQGAGIGAQLSVETNEALPIDCG